MYIHVKIVYMIYVYIYIYVCVCVYIYIYYIYYLWNACISTPRRGAFTDHRSDWSLTVAIRSYADLCDDGLYNYLLHFFIIIIIIILFILSFFQSLLIPSCMYTCASRWCPRKKKLNKYIIYYSALVTK